MKEEEKKQKEGKKATSLFVTLWAGNNNNVTHFWML